MLNRPCIAPRCPSVTKGFSNLCNAHRKTQRRHGHFDQTGISVHELRPFVAKVTAWQQANPDSAAWAIPLERWDRIVGHANKTLRAYQDGRPMAAHEIEAARYVNTLAGTVSPQQVLRTALAVYQLARDQPHRFKSDRAFDFQLARRVRGLATVSAYSYRDYKTRKTRHVYRDMAPRATVVLASWLKDAFGFAGLVLEDPAERREQAERDERQRLADAMAALR